MNNTVDYLGYQISVETLERRVSSAQRVWSARFQLAHGSEVVRRYAQACDGVETQEAAIDQAVRIGKMAIDARIDVRVMREQRWPASSRKGPADRASRDLAARPAVSASDS